MVHHTTWLRHMLAQIAESIKKPTQVTAQYETISVGKIPVMVKRVAKVVMAPIIDDIDYEDPEVKDLVKFAVRMLVEEGKTHAADIVLSMFGLSLETRKTSDPCKSRYEMIIDRKFKEFWVFKEWKRVKKPTPAHYAGYEEHVAYGLLVDNDNNVYLAKYTYNRSFDLHNTTTYTTLQIVPLEPVRITVVEKGERVRCGPDGDATPYEEVYEYVFPPA